MTLKSENSILSGDFVPVSEEADKSENTKKVIL